MAGSGLISLGEVADKLQSLQPSPVSKVAAERLRKMDAVLPYIFDAINAMRTDGTTYPGGTLISALDHAFFIAAKLDL